MVAAILKRMFDKVGHNALVAGVQLVFPDGTEHRLFFKLVLVVADEAALRAFWRCVGAGGVKSCLMCINVVKHGVESNDLSGLLIPHTAARASEFKQQTRPELMYVLNDLRAKKAFLSKTAFSSRTCLLVASAS